MSSGNDVLSLAEVLALLGRCRCTVHRMVADGRLAPPLTKRPSTWAADAVHAALKARATVVINPDASPLAQARQRRGWSQAKVAGLLGVANSDVCSWERGRRPGRRFRTQVATLLGQPVGDLWPESRDADGAR